MKLTKEQRAHLQTLPVGTMAMDLLDTCDALEAELAAAQLQLTVTDKAWKASQILKDDLAAARDREKAAIATPDVDICWEHAPNQTDKSIRCGLPVGHEGQHYYSWSTVSFFWPNSAEREKAAIAAALEPFSKLLRGLEPFQGGRDGDMCLWCQRDRSLKIDSWEQSQDPEYHDTDCEFIAAIRAITPDQSAARGGASQGEGQSPNGNPPTTEGSVRTEG